MNINAREFFEQESDAPVRFRHTSSSDTDARKSRRPSFGRRGKSPQQFNGIHRRRKKKIQW
ncbi:MAG: hypothetical protein KDA60_13640 [Planctomycetales bacterium]|nr:hypothetical protein [Planctomycetales bacterium]